MFEDCFEYGSRLVLGRKLGGRSNVRGRLSLLSKGSCRSAARLLREREAAGTAIHDTHLSALIKYAVC